MKRCPYCACMVDPGNRCWSCGAPVPSEKPAAELCACGGKMEVVTFYGGATRTACPRCGQGRVENIPPPVAVVLDKDFKIVPPSRSDEGFDLMGQVGRVGRKTR